jgi:hypothetical protein
MSTNSESTDPPAEAADNWWGTFLASDTDLAAATREGILRAAYQAYLAEFGRLPGSARTSRLRKKRYTRVVNWYCDECLPSRRAQPEPECQREPTWMPEGEFSIENILNLAASFPPPDREST